LECGKAFGINGPDASSLMRAIILRLAKMQMPLTERRETAELLEVAPAGPAQQGRGANRFSFRHNEAGPGLLFGAI